ncbi:hypothetical protein NLI96_g7746 [Meripilus lineatus]|uniref:Thaumatin-like protein n=1 Tax=Meripilus lineatus TaxID=2056292 RepID=A0AAD5V0S5_9APHY|nr:hypothetical protein NLI96_g7746 [Physisporinus lineatus]
MRSCVLLPLFAASVAYARQLTVYNGCPFTIWPAMFTDLNVGSAVPSFPNGWEAPAFSHVSFFVPDNWKAGRIWVGISHQARRNCNFNDPNPATQCADGGCNGGLVCDSHTGTGIPPTSLAEFTLSGDNGHNDFYDVSLVSGYNLPVRIDTNQGCPVAGCFVDLGPNCPAPLKGPFDSTGFPVGCKSACLIDPNPGNSTNCCTGAHSTPTTCPSSGVQFFDYFKSNCPKASAYAFDQATFNCDTQLQADYIVSFCAGPPQ